MPPAPTSHASTSHAPSAEDRSAAADAADPAGLSLSVEELTASMARSLSERSGRIDFDPERVEQDLARLVLCLVEFLRQLMEAQAVRRMEAGRLSAEEEERLGLTLMRAREKVLEVAAAFGLEETDLRLELGPLGRLV